MHPPSAPRDVIVSENAAVARPHQDEAARTRALEIFLDIGLKFCPEAGLLQTIAKEEGSIGIFSPSLRAVTAHKSTSTLQKRSIALRQYHAWILTTAWTAQDFFTEPAVFSYLQYLADSRAPVTRAASCREALNLYGTLFAIEVGQVRASTRIHGLCCQQLRGRAEVRQREPFTADMVRAFESIVLDPQNSLDDAVIAGATLFAILARTRIGDMRKCLIEPSLDMAPDLRNGFLETKFREHKTARPGSRAAMPITAPTMGLSTSPWGPAWKCIRAKAGLRADRDGTLLPARAPGGWWSVDYSTTEFAAAFRTLLLKTGFSHDQLSHIGAHSCKATMLSWLAKWGASKEDRTMLGYHALREDKAMDAYSRDVMAGPLRALVRLLTDVREGIFVPDATRSGTFIAKPATASEDTRCSTEAPEDKEELDDGSSSSCSSASERVSEDEAKPVSNIVLNLRAGFHHRILCGGLVCGKPLTDNLVRLPDVPAGGRLCARCW